MQKNKLPDDLKEFILTDTLKGWLEGAAMMLTSISIMQALELTDKEEGSDMVTRLTALVKQGAAALGAPGKSSFDDLAEEALGVQSYSVDAMRNLLENMKEQFEKD